MGALGLAKELAGELRQVFREVTRPQPRQQVPRDTPGPVWPHPGDTRIRGGITEIWSAGWQTPQREESRTTSSMVANPDYARAQKARQARAPRPGRTTR